MRKLFKHAALAAAVCTAAASTAGWAADAASNYPSKPVRLIGDFGSTAVCGPYEATM